MKPMTPRMPMAPYVLIVACMTCLGASANQLDSAGGYSEVFANRPDIALWFSHHAVDPEVRAAALAKLRSWAAEEDPDNPLGALVLSEITRLQGDSASAFRQCLEALQSLEGRKFRGARIDAIDVVLASSAAWQNEGKIKVGQQLRSLVRDALPFDGEHRDQWLLLLRRAHYRAEHRSVIELIETWWQQDDRAKQDLELALLSARSRGQLYYEYHDATSESTTEARLVTARNLKALAESTTEAYERVMALSDEPYRRMQIYREWWGHNAHRGFEADSKVLREASGLFRSDRDEPIAPAIVQQAQRLEDAFVDSVQEPSRIQADVRQVARLLADEYVLLVSAEIPRDRYDALLEGLADFTAFGFPNSINSEAFGMTLRWYLWNALFQPELDDQGRALMQAQNHVVSIWILDAFSRNKEHHLLREMGREESLRFMEWQQRAETNPWFPYFKQPLQPHEWHYAGKRVHDEINKRREHREKRVNDDPSLLDGDVDSFFRQGLRGDAFGLRFWVQVSLTHYDRPGFRSHLPTRWITACSSRMNDRNTHVFSVDEWKLFPEGETKAYISGTRKREGR